MPENTDNKRDKRCAYPSFFMKGVKMFASFYYVDREYIQYLQNAEIKARNFTCVPNVNYANKTKFVYGVVMEIESNNLKIPYFVPVSSYTKNQSNNLLIKIKDNKKFKTVGSLRFNYMIPVPTTCIKKVEFRSAEFAPSYKLLLEQEYRYIKKTLKPTLLQKKAKETYDDVIQNHNKDLVNNSCDFLTLEKAYLSYIQNNLPAPQ